LVVIIKKLLFFQNPLIPDEKREAVVSHIVLVQQSVVVYSKKFLQRLRRSNYVTPKNYLDFINTYLRLLDDKDKSILAQVGGFYL
jgi:dynein heavy chain